MPRRFARIAPILVPMFLVAACAQTIPKEALELSPTTLEDRQRETRIFATTDENEILAASAAVLQDLGFTLEESETDLGVIVASKDRDATEADQVAGRVVLAVFFGVWSPIDDVQKIRVSLITRPLTGDREGIAVRVTFQRVVWDTEGNISKNESLDDATLFQAFFDKLSKSVFLEAEQV